MRLSLLYKLASYEHHPLFDELKKLNIPKEHYTLFGSGPLYMHGIRDNIHDLDVLVSKEAWKDIKKKYKKHLITAASGDKILSIPTEHGDIEIFPQIYPRVIDPKDILSKSKVINDIPAASLEHIMEWKKALGRPKDLKDVENISKYIERSKEMEKYWPHLLANFRVAGRSLALAILHAAHGLIPIEYTSHHYWNI